MTTPGTPDPTPEPSEPAGGGAPAAGGPTAAPGPQPGPPPYTDPSAAPPYGSSYGQPPYGAQPGYGQPAYGAAVPLSPSEERLWATLAHVGGIVFWFLAPLVIWLIFRERSRFVDDQAKEALNFQILLNIAYVVSFALMGVLIGFITYPVAFVAGLVLCILAGVAANRGELYRYPFNWRVVK